jgi:hypothetical protein
VATHSFEKAAATHGSPPRVCAWIDILQVSLHLNGLFRSTCVCQPRWCTCLVLHLRLRANLIASSSLLVPRVKIILLLIIAAFPQCKCSAR